MDLEDTLWNRLSVCSLKETPFNIFLFYSQGWLVDLINKFGTLNGFQMLHDRFMSGQALNVQIIAALIKWASMKMFNVQMFVNVLTSLWADWLIVFSAFQAFWPVLWVPHIAHGKEVLPPSHRDGSSVSRESHRWGAEERGQEWSQKRRTVHDNQVSEESSFSRTRAGGDGEKFRDF